jgi:hypothetical protein
MNPHTRDHPRHSRDRLKDNSAMSVSLGKEGVGEEAEKRRHASCEQVTHC